jgi:hypothetical protein
MNSLPMFHKHSLLLFVAMLVLMLVLPLVLVPFLVVMVVCLVPANKHTNI